MDVRQETPKTQIRKVWIIVGCVLLLVVLTACLPWLNHELRVNPRRTMPLDAYTVVLSQTNQGELLYTMQSTGDYFADNAGSSWGQGEPLYVYCSIPILPSKTPDAQRKMPHTFTTDLVLRDGVLYWRDDEEMTNGEEVQEIRQGTEGKYRVIYLAGDVIPLCSAALEREYTLREKIRRISDETERQIHILQEQLGNELEEQKRVYEEEILLSSQ